jgi:hypothetical protein
MDKRLLGWLCAPVLSSAVVFGQASPASGRIEARAPSAAAQPTAPVSMTVSLRGRIDRYDPATRTLSLITDRGTIRLTLPSSIRIRQGAHKVDAVDLRWLVGDQATVRYTESSSNKTVESVHVFDR